MMRTSLFLAAIAAFVAPGMASPACKPKTTRTTTATTTTTGPDTLPASCTFRPQATWYANSGCQLNCPTEPLCIADAIVTQSCGCTRMAVSPTTTTLCATASSNCQPNCSTGWGIWTVTESNCPPGPTATVTAA